MNAREAASWVLKEIIIKGGLTSRAAFSLVQDLWNDSDPDVLKNAVHAVSVFKENKRVLKLLQQAQEIELAEVRQEAAEVMTTIQEYKSFQGGSPPNHEAMVHMRMYQEGGYPVCLRDLTLP